MEKREQEGKPHKFGRNSNTSNVEAVSEVEKKDLIESPWRITSWMSEVLIQRDLGLLPQPSRGSGDAQSYMAQSFDFPSQGGVQLSFSPY